MSYTDLYYDWLTISSRNNDFNTYHLYSSNKRVMMLNFLRLWITRKVANHLNIIVKVRIEH